MKKSKQRATGAKGRLKVKAVRKVREKPKHGGTLDKLPAHVHPYGTKLHADLDWHERRFKKLLERVPSASREATLQAYTFAKHQHDGQVRRGGSPYIIHPLRIANILMGEWRYSEAPMLCAALLHDVVEDTPITIREIKDKFGEEVGKLVDGMTMWKGSETYALYCKRVSRGPDALRLIKCADALDNLRSWHEQDIASADLNRWWKNTVEHIVPIAQATSNQACTAIQSTLSNPWYLRMAKMTE